jgi:hypothetical protein
MNADVFDSPLISQILTWLFSIPTICAIVFGAVGMLFEKQQGVPRIYTIWLLICLILFTPVRYILLQFLTAVAFPFQSWAGLFSTFLLAPYVPIVFILLCALGLGVPFLLTALIAGKKEPPSKGRLILASAAAPIIFLVFSTIYYNVLPWAAYSTHWVGPKEIIRTANGPPYFFYRYVVEPFTPLQFSRVAYDRGLHNMTAKERFRAHLAGVYCGRDQEWYYVSKAYPDYVEQLRQESQGKERGHPISPPRERGN